MNNHLRGIDFAALATLRLVYRRRSFTVAAEELNLKQSSVSYTIERLRNAFLDPLFVRQGGSIAPTDRCIEIVAAAERILGEAERAALPREFDPATSTASVTISATYLSRSVLMPRVVQELRQEAPGISVELITGFTDARRHLLSGHADLALTPVAIEESGIYGTTILEDPYVCLMDPENPLARGPLTPESFASATHLVIHYGQTWRPLYQDALKERGLTLKVAVSTPDPEDVRFMIPRTDLVAALPSWIARQFEQGLHICPCPVPADTPVNMYWPARLNHSPLQEWLRAKVLRVAQELPDT
ncbi:MAG: LysR family transcriptional regulator [Rhodobacteraceae bacterium]|nr:LysR family transcriptional regulator [Paracoccaceae bacterium]